MTIKEFFKKYNKIALAFSGGADSAYLLYEAKRYADDVTAYYVKSAFQPEFELNDAIKFAQDYGVKLKILHLDVLSDESIASNPQNRCYFCKRKIFDALRSQAEKDGYGVIVDGTNASDAENDRPGMRALKELSVLSPLRECGLTKDEIRRNSKEIGLFTHDKPAYACLATRIPCGVRITQEKLSRTEKAESFLFSLGFSDFRVRERDNCARLEIKENQIPLFNMLKQEIISELEKYYESVIPDAEVR